MAFLLLLFLLVAHAQSCHPECTNDGGANVYPADCIHVCSKPNCTNTCDGCVAFPTCRIECPEDQCESDSCPACALLCNEPVCIPDPYSNCTIECQELECSWSCRAPATCPGNCTCDEPACAYSGSVISVTVNLVVILCIVLLL